MDERRALIRKFAIKGDDFGMKGINKVPTLVEVEILKDLQMLAISFYQCICFCNIERI